MTHSSCSTRLIFLVLHSLLTVEFSRPAQEQPDCEAKTQICLRTGNLHPRIILFKRVLKLYYSQIDRQTDTCNADRQTGMSSL